MKTETEPNVTAYNIKWNNRIDEVYGLLCLIISKDLIFHLDSLTTLNEVWEKIQYFFGKTYKMRGHC